MQAQLKIKLSHWKFKCIFSTQVKRMLSARLYRREKRISELESEIIRLREITEPQRVPAHTYPAQMIALAVFMVVHAGSSLRCAAKTAGFFSYLMGWGFSVPSHITIRNWVLRCGLYSYEYIEKKVGKYVGIIDESIQMGSEKLLLLLGVKLEDDRCHAAPLRMSDVEVLGMEVRASWKGDEIADFIDQRLEVHQAIKLQYVISDQGRPLLAALKKLKIDIVGDCTHIMMNIAKKLFATDEQLSKLSAQIGRLRQQLTLTNMAYLLPPSLRDKDRFLRVFTIVGWADRINAYWDKLPEKSRQKLDFLQQAQPLIQCMRQLRALIIITADIFKYSGLNHISIQLWEDKIAQFAKQNILTKQAKAFIEEMRKYFEKHQSLIDKYKNLLCCSDIIEATFGKYKNKGGTKIISADILSIALYDRQISTQFVYDALTTIHQKDSIQWAKKHTCDNRFSIMRRMDRELKNDTAIQ